MTRADARVDVEVLRSRHALPAVVESTGVALRPTGRGFIGCCPFHEDSTASFSVDGVPDRYHCFGCGASGDVIDYVARLKGLSFLDAVASLETGGFPTAVAHPRQGMAASVETPIWPTRPRAFEIHALAWAYFTRPVSHATAAAILRRRRGMDVRDLESALGQPVVGLAGDGWTSLTDHLTRQGVSVEELLALDLARTSSRGTVIDVLRSRIVLPVREPDTRVRGFLARDTSGHPRAPRYLNPTRTVVFEKAMTLYRADHRATPPQATTVVVEGPLDALAIACATASAHRLDALRSCQHRRYIRQSASGRCHRIGKGLRGPGTRRRPCRGRRDPSPAARARPPPASPCPCPGRATPQRRGPGELASPGPHTRALP